MAGLPQKGKRVRAADMKTTYDDKINEYLKDNFGISENELKTCFTDGMTSGQEMPDEDLRKAFQELEISRLAVQN